MNHAKGREKEPDPQTDDQSANEEPEVGKGDRAPETSRPALSPVHEPPGHQNAAQRTSKPESETDSNPDDAWRSAARSPPAALVPKA